MGLITGFAGHVGKGTTGGGGEAAISGARQWGIASQMDLQAAISSATKGAPVRVDGNKPWSGQFSGYGYKPPVLPGDAFQFGGAISGVAAAAFGAKGDVMCSQVVIAIDQEGKKPIVWTAQFQGVGALTLGTITVPADAAAPTVYPSAGCKVNLAAVDGTGEAELVDVRTATLTLTNKVQTAHTSTSGVWPTGAKGGYDASLDLSVYARSADGWASLPAPGVVKQVKLFVDDVKFWLLKWMKFGELGGLDVDIEGQSFVGASLKAALSGFEDTGGGTRVVGAITDPDSATWWPAA